MFRHKAGYMLSRCFNFEAQTSIDKLLRLTSPAFLNSRAWRKHSQVEVAKVTRVPAPQPLTGLMRSQLSCECVIVADYKLYVFIEVLVRPGMLLGFHDPRRNRDAPGGGGGSRTPVRKCSVTRRATCLVDALISIRRRPSTNFCESHHQHF